MSTATPLLRPTRSLTFSLSKWRRNRPAAISWIPSTRCWSRDALIPPHAARFLPILRPRAWTGRDTECLWVFRSSWSSKTERPFPRLRVTRVQAQLVRVDRTDRLRALGGMEWAGTDLVATAPEVEPVGP